MNFSWLQDRRRTLVFIFSIALLVKFICFIIGIIDNRYLDIEGAPDLFSLGEVEAFRDYGGAYLPTIEAFKSGYTPYLDFWYAYPPLFLYLLTAFSLLPFGFWGAALPLILFDAFSVVVVYLIGVRFLSKKQSFFVSLLFMLAPINLFYNDYLWLNSPLVTLCALLTTYCLLTNRYKAAAIALGLSFGFKQTGLLLFPAAVLLIYKKSGVRQAVTFFLLFTVVGVAVSMPYLLTVPQHYLWCLRVPVSQPDLVPEYYQRVAPAHLLGGTEPERTYPISGNAPLNSAIPLFVLMSQGLEGETLVTYFNSFMGSAKVILDVVLLASFGVLLWKMYREHNLDDHKVNMYMLLSLFLFHSFYSRGVYKYYFAMITPFLVLYLSDKRGGILFIMFNLAVFLVPRFLSPWILFPLLIYFILKQYRLASYPKLG